MAFKKYHGITYFGTEPMKFANMVIEEVGEIVVREKKRMRHKAERLRDMVVNIVEKGGDPVILNSNKYRARKINKGLNDSPLKATGQYAKNIVVKRTGTMGKDGELTYSVGVNNINHKKVKGLFNNPVPMTVLADVLEFGYGTIPARPHWRPAWAKFKRVFKVGVLNG